MLTEPHPIDGLTGLLDRFARFSLVALGELHGVEQGAHFIADLVRDPRFAQRVQAIVVEFGNAIHQAAVDEFVAGGDVPFSDVRRALHDFAGAVGAWGFRAPIYSQFFLTIRELNRTLPLDRRIRVLLGDPPVDWSTIRTPEDAKTVATGRDEHFAAIVEREVLARGTVRCSSPEPFICFDRQRRQAPQSRNSSSAPARSTWSRRTTMSAFPTSSASSKHASPRGRIRVSPRSPPRGSASSRP